MTGALTCEIATRVRAVFALVVAFSCASAQTSNAPDTSAGWLVLHGGRLVERTVAERFAALAGLPEGLLVRNHPEVLFLGIDEDTSAIVHNGEFEVIGPGKVFACGGKTGGDQACVSLSAGQTYHLKP